MLGCQCKVSVQDAKINSLLLQPTHWNVHSSSTHSKKVISLSNQFNQTNQSFNWAQNVSSTVAFGQQIVRPMQWISRAANTASPVQQKHLFELQHGFSYPSTSVIYSSSTASQIPNQSRQDELSNNISSILESLLHGYDKNQRPFQKSEYFQQLMYKRVRLTSSLKRTLSFLIKIEKK